MKLDVNAKTDVGRTRDHNEDDFAVFTGADSPVGAEALLIVADGMGGHAAGEVASRMAVEEFAARFNAECALFASASDSDYSSLCKVVLTDVNYMVWEAAKAPGQIGMGTTFTAAVLRAQKLFVCHVGDSRAYLLREGVLSQVTKDHSWVEDAVDAGILTREEARIHPNSNVITRAIGLDEIVQVDLVVEELNPGDTLMMCSDGLNSMVSDDEIEMIMCQNPIGVAVDILVDTANDKGGRDNITVLGLFVSQ